MRGMITGNGVSAGGERYPLGGRRPREARGLGREELGMPLQQDGQVMYSVETNHRDRPAHRKLIIK